MPKGHVKWFDPSDGRGTIEHAGREYAVDVTELPRDARTSGAPVHFDISHRDAGDVAVNVSFRGGSRTSRRTGRYGDQTGARSSSAKEWTGRPDVGVHVPERRAHEIHPGQVVEDWARFLAEGQTDRAAALYAPDATIRTGGDAIAGHRDIRRHLATSPIDGATADVRGLDAGRFRVLWRTRGRGRRMAVVTLRVQHGKIVEHTERVVAATGADATSQEPGSQRPAMVQTAVVHGTVPAHAVAYAEGRVQEVVAHASAPVLHARLALAHEENPAIRRAAIAKASLDVDGQLVRAHVAAESFGEAADLLKDRLRRGLDALRERSRTRRADTGDSGEGEWRHGDLPTDRPDHYPRPPEQREVVRHKTYALRHLTVEDAALELDVLDFDWLLFTELRTGADAVIERRGDGYGLRVAGEPPPTDGLAVPIEVIDAVPTMQLAEAVSALDVGDLPFQFFIEAAGGRGAVVYRRYDGHYGLIVPATRRDQPLTPGGPQS